MYSHCGRSSGRSRIGTSSTPPETRGSLIAVALRGDRGLEQSFPLRFETRYRLRSLFGAIEDWNVGALAASHPNAIAVALRGDRGLEPLNNMLLNFLALLRSLFGAIEDWNNFVLSYSRAVICIAVALRGDRGLEQYTQMVHGIQSRIAVALRGDRGLEH